MTFPLAAALIALAAAAAPGQIATVTPLAGDPVTGQLVQLTGEQVVAQAGGASKKFSASDLLAVEFAAEKVSDKPAVWIELLDGSKLLAATYTVQAGKASLVLIGGVTVEIPTRSIYTVRFRQQDAQLAQQWREIVAAPHSSDLIVVRKTSMRTIEDGDAEPKTVTETALDELDGTLLDVLPDSVNFEFDGDKIDVKREKIEGLVYYHSVRRELPPGVCRLIDAAGSQWTLKSLELAGDKLAIVSAAGASATLPVASVSKLDFSVGNIADLTELEPDTGDGEPVVSLQPVAMTAKFGRMFRVSKSPPLGADGFKIGGKSYSTGLSLHSPATLVYRVPEGFRKLHAVAGVDDSIVAPGEFAFQILGDGKEMFRHECGGSDSRGPVVINLDLTGIRRISLVLDPADGQDIGDQLNLCEARLTR
jgi:hypothetical protein